MPVSWAQLVQGLKHGYTVECCKLVFIFNIDRCSQRIQTAATVTLRWPETLHGLYGVLCTRSEPPENRMESTFLRHEAEVCELHGLVFCTSACFSPLHMFSQQNMRNAPPQLIGPTALLEYHTVLGVVC